MKKICFVTTVYMTYKCFLKQLSQYLYETGEYDFSLICINAAFYTSIAARRKKVPVRLYCQWGIRYMGFEGWKRSLFKYLEKKTCDNSTFIEVESHNIRNFSLEEKLYTADRSCVIWNGSASGVDLNKFDISKKKYWREKIREILALSENDIVFAFAGRLTADKGVNELLAAFLNIEKKHTCVKLLMLGGMDNHKSLNQELLSKILFLQETCPILKNIMRHQMFL